MLRAEVTRIIGVQCWKGFRRRWWCVESGRARAFGLAEMAGMGMEGAKESQGETGMAGAVGEVEVDHSRQILSQA